MRLESVIIKLDETSPMSSSKASILLVFSPTVWTKPSTCPSRELRLESKLSIFVSFAPILDVFPPMRPFNSVLLLSTVSNTASNLLWILSSMFCNALNSLLVMANAPALIPLLNVTACVNVFVPVNVVLSPALTPWELELWETISDNFSPFNFNSPVISTIPVTSIASVVDDVPMVTFFSKVFSSVNVLVVLVWALALWEIISDNFSPFNFNSPVISTIPDTSSVLSRSDIEFFPIAILSWK